MADQVVEPGGSHEPTEFAKTPKKAKARKAKKTTKAKKA